MLILNLVRTAPSVFLNFITFKDSPLCVALMESWWLNSSARTCPGPHASTHNVKHVTLSKSDALGHSPHRA